MFDILLVDVDKKNWKIEFGMSIVFRVFSQDSQVLASIYAQKLGLWRLQFPSHLGKVVPRIRDETVTRHAPAAAYLAIGTCFFIVGELVTLINFWESGIQKSLSTFGANSVVFPIRLQLCWCDSEDQHCTGWALYRHRNGDSHVFTRTPWIWFQNYLSHEKSWDTGWLRGLPLMMGYRNQQQVR